MKLIKNLYLSLHLSFWGFTETQTHCFNWLLHFCFLGTFWCGTCEALRSLPFRTTTISVWDYITFFLRMHFWAIFWGFCSAKKSIITVNEYVAVNFCFQLNFIFPCLKLIIIHHIPKNKGKLINFNCRNKKLTVTCTCTTQFENLVNSHSHPHYFFLTDRLSSKDTRNIFIWCMIWKITELI